MSEVMETIVMPELNEFCRDKIDRSAAEALRDANWYAAHTMRFLHVTKRTDTLYMVERIRDSAKFYRDEWSPSDVSEQAFRDYDDALKIVENIERVVLKMGDK